MEAKYLEEYRKKGIDMSEIQEKLDIPVVRQRFIDRKEKLLRDQEYYNMCMKGGGKFNPHVKFYIQTIPSRIEELNYILENVI